MTREPLEGWSYAAAHEAVDAGADTDGDPYAAADGVEIISGAAETDGTI